MNGPVLGPTLPAKSDNFTNEEVLAVLRKLRAGKAAGPDDIQAEFWNTLKDDDECVSWLAGLCSRCLREGVVPEEWKSAHVGAIYKKGEVDNCEKAPLAYFV